MHPQFDSVFIRVREIISYMMESPELEGEYFDWVDIELKAIMTARAELNENELMTNNRLLTIVEEVINEQIDNAVRKKITEETNDIIMELLDEGKIRMAINPDGEIVYELNDNE